MKNPFIFTAYWTNELTEWFKQPRCKWCGAIKCTLKHKIKKNKMKGY